MLTEKAKALIEEAVGKGLIETSYYKKVPKDFQENILYRQDVIKSVYSDGRLNKKAAEELWIACSRDPLFYINTFVYTYDPRRIPPKLPFITYEFQDETLLALIAAIMLGKDVLIEKSRDMGASWMCLVAMEWLWHFRMLQSFLMVSRKEDLVDKTEDPDCLYWKVDFIHKNLPKWLRPPTVRNKLHLSNKENESTIDGASTTGDVGRGGRRSSVLLDEFASVEDGYAVLAATRDVTLCRIMNSTPKGAGNAFADMANNDDVVKIRLHWTLHPDKAKGLYYDADGKPRSPWYDEQCRRAANPVEIAQELDIDYHGSEYQFFSGERLVEIEKEQCKPPLFRGRLEYDEITLEPIGLVSDPAGRLMVWTPLDMGGRPRSDATYIIGGDIAAGSHGAYASNSCLSIGDAMRSEKVAEYAVPDMLPFEFAKEAVALCKFFKGSSRDGAFLIWEANGPGREFGEMVMRYGYRNIFYRRNESSVTKKVTTFPGWYSTKETKLLLFGNYRQAYGTTFKNPSIESVKEARRYIHDPNSGIYYSGTQKTIDPTGAKDNHGDRVVSDALCYHGMSVFNVKVTPDNEEEKNNLSFFSFAGRRKQYEAALRAEREW